MTNSQPLRSLNWKSVPLHKGDVEHDIPVHKAHPGTKQIVVDVVEVMKGYTSATPQSQMK
jgi:hypothetical protein